MIVTFMGVGCAMGKVVHIRMSVIYDVLPVSARKGLRDVISEAAAVKMAVLALTAFQYLLTSLPNLNFAEGEVYVSYLEVDS